MVTLSIYTHTHTPDCYLKQQVYFEMEVWEHVVNLMYKQVCKVEHTYCYLSQGVESLLVLKPLDFVLQHITL